MVSMPPQPEWVNEALVVQQLPHRPFFLPLLKRFQELNGLKLQMVGLEAHTNLAWQNRLIWFDIQVLFVFFSRYLTSIATASREYAWTSLTRLETHYFLHVWACLSEVWPIQGKIHLMLAVALVEFFQQKKSETKWHHFVNKIVIPVPTCTFLMAKLSGPWGGPSMERSSPGSVQETCRASCRGDFSLWCYSVANQMWPPRQDHSAPAPGFSI